MEPLGTLVAGLFDPGIDPADQDSAAPALGVCRYRSDDSVFFDHDYIIKGVVGRILWKLLTEYSTDGMVTSP